MTELVFFFFNLVYGAGLLWAVKYYIQRDRQHLDNRLDELKSVGDGQRERQEDLEKDLLRLRAELPQNYVRREDAIRNTTVIEAKLDRLNDKLDRYGSSRN